MKKVEIKDLIEKEWYTVTFSRRKSYKNGIRVKPYIKLKLTDSDLVDRIEFELLDYGINCSTYENGIILTSVSSCNLALKFLEPPIWWRKAFFMIKDGKHTSREGILKILEKRNEETDPPSNENGIWTKEKAIRIMSEHNNE